MTVIKFQPHDGQPIPSLHCTEWDSDTIFEHLENQGLNVIQVTVNNSHITYRLDNTIYQTKAWKDEAA